MDAHVIAVVGATATGKSGLAVELARALRGEIVNADSMQLYQGMDIGSAKEPEAARQGVPHHLLDIWPVTQAANVADYAKLARAAIEEITARGRMPILVGGSGLYVRAALDDLNFPGTDWVIRSRLEDELTRRGGPARPAGRPRPGRGGRDPAEQRTPDRPRPGGDRDLRAPVHRDHAGLPAEPPGGPDRPYAAPPRTGSQDRRPGRPDVAGGTGGRSAQPGRPGPARGPDRQPGARLPAAAPLPGRRMDPRRSPPGDDQGHQALRPPPGILVPPRPPRHLARRDQPRPALRSPPPRPPLDHPPPRPPFMITKGLQSAQTVKSSRSTGTPEGSLLELRGQRFGAEQPGQQLRLERQRPETDTDADLVLRPVHDLDLVAGADLAGLDHPQVGAGPAGLREPLDPASLRHPALEGGARNPGAGHLEDTHGPVRLAIRFPLAGLEATSGCQAGMRAWHCRRRASGSGAPESVRNKDLR